MLESAWAGCQTPDRVIGEQSRPALAQDEFLTPAVRENWELCRQHGPPAAHQEIAAPQTIDLSDRRMRCR